MNIMPSYSSSLKNSLQEFCQKHGLPMPKYYTVQAYGNDHAPVWRCEIYLGDKLLSTAQQRGKKKNAEQEAARLGLEKLGVRITPAHRPVLMMNGGGTDLVSYGASGGFLPAPSQNEPYIVDSQSGSGYASSPMPAQIAQQSAAPQHYPQPSSVAGSSSGATLHPINDPQYTSTSKSSSSAPIDPRSQFRKLNKKIVVLVDQENMPNEIGILTERITDQVNISFVAFATNHHPSLAKLARYSTDRRLEIIAVPSAHKNASDVALCMMAGTYLLLKNYQVYFILSRDHFVNPLADCIRNLSRLTNTPGTKEFEAFVCPTADAVFENLEQFLANDDELD